MIPWLVLLQASLTIAVSGPATNPEYWPLRIADAEGYFAQENVTVSLDTPRAEAGAAEALARGEVDLAATSVDAAMRFGHLRGAPPKLVFGLTSSPPVVLLAPSDQKERIVSLSDLIGKTVGIPSPGTPEEMALLWLLAKAEIKPPQVTVRSFGDRRLAGALLSGEVAAAVLGDPFATRLIESGRVTALIDLRKRDELARQLGQPTVHAALFARADSTLGPAQLKPLIRALLKATGRLETAAPEEIAAKMPAAVVGFPEDWAARLLGAREIFLRDGLVTAGMLGASIVRAQLRSPMPVKVSIPRNLDKLLLTDSLREVLDSRH